MIFARALLGQELIVFGAIGLALGLIYAYLRGRRQLDLLRRVWPPTLLWAVFGPLDALVTIVGTWGDPWREANPALRAWLIWDGWVGQVISTFLYVLFWAAVVIGLEEGRRRSGGVWEYPLGAAQILTLYTLAIEHLAGFLSWTPYLQPIMPLIGWLDGRAPWLFADSPLALFLNFALIVGAFLTAAQLASAALVRGMRMRAPVARPAPGPVVPPGRIDAR